MRFNHYHSLALVLQRPSMIAAGRRVYVTCSQSHIQQFYYNLITISASKGGDAPAAQVIHAQDALYELHSLHRVSLSSVLHTAELIAILNAASS